MRNIFILLFLFTINKSGNAIVITEDSIWEQKISKRIIQLISKECDLTDSISKELYVFFSERYSRYRNCIKDSLINVHSCRVLIDMIEKDIKKEFGKEVYNAYNKIVHPPPCFPHPIIKNNNKRPQRNIRLTN